MSLEEQMAEMTAALKENTAAHLQLGEIAKAASGAKAATKSAPAEEKAKPSTAKAKAEPEPEDEPGEKAKPAPKSTARKPKAPTLKKTVTRAALTKVARAFMSPDDEEVRDAKKTQFGAALAHIGAAKLSEMDDEDLPRLAGYLAYWKAGLEVDFEEIDEMLSGGGDGEDDDMI